MKASIVLEVLTGKLRVAQAARKYKIKDSVIYGWRNDAIDKLPMLFTTQSSSDRDPQKVEALERLIGQQAVEIELLKKAGHWLSRLSKSSDGL